MKVAAFVRATLGFTVIAAALAAVVRATNMPLRRRRRSRSRCPCSRTSRVTSKRPAIRPGQFGRARRAGAGLRPGHQLHRRAVREEGHVALHHRAGALQAQGRRGEGVRDSAQATLTQNQAEYQRQADLIQKQVSTQANYDKALAQRDSSQADLQSAQANEQQAEINSAIPT